MTIDSEDDLIALREIGAIVAGVLELMGSSLEPGMTTRELDQIGAKALADAGAQSAPQVTYQFPGATCISVNECVAHGIPGGHVIAAGDMINIDVSAEKNGYFADTGATFLVPPSLPVQKAVCHATKRARAAALAALKDGVPLNALGAAVEKVAKAVNLRVIRNLAGHGVGRSLHDDPAHIYSHFVRSDRRRAKKGMVLAIEPFLSTRTRDVWEADDGWSLMIAQGSYAAQYEHTVVVTDGAPIITTLPPSVA